MIEFFYDLRKKGEEIAYETSENFRTLEDCMKAMQNNRQKDDEFTIWREFKDTHETTVVLDSDFVREGAK